MVFYLSGNRCGIPAQFFSDTLKAPALVNAGLDNVSLSVSYMFGAL
jgi:hypothetical protein